MKLKFINRTYFSIRKIYKTPMMLAYNDSSMHRLEICANVSVKEERTNSGAYTLILYDLDVFMQLSKQIEYRVQKGHLHNCRVNKIRTVWNNDSHPRTMYLLPGARLHTRLHRPLSFLIHCILILIYTDI